jgi:hypothetical protein
VWDLRRATGYHIPEDGIHLLSCYLYPI